MSCDEKKIAFQEYFREIYKQYNKTKLTMRECAIVLGVKETTFKALKKAGRLPPYHTLSSKKFGMGRPKVYFNIHDIAWWLVYNDEKVY